MERNKDKYDILIVGSGLYGALSAWKAKKEGKKCDEKQAERIAWRNVKDWIAAQLALVETEQAAMEQVFLPYLLDQENRTLSQRIAESNFAP